MRRSVSSCLSTELAHAWPVVVLIVCVQIVWFTVRVLWGWSTLSARHQSWVYVFLSAVNYLCLTSSIQGAQLRHAILVTAHHTRSLSCTALHCTDSTQSVPPQSSVS